MKSICIFISIFLSISSHAQNVARWVVATPSGCKVNTFLQGEIKINFTGECKNGFVNGRGKTIIYKDGAVFGEGVVEYSQGISNGWIDFSYKDGKAYTGEIKNGLLHGQGIYKLSNGKIKIGEWLDAKPNGEFIEIDENGIIEKSGIYENGKLIISQFVDINKFSRLNETKNKILPNIDKFELQNYLNNSNALKDLGHCKGEDITKWSHCKGFFISHEGHPYLNKGDKYIGEFINGKAEGKGIFIGINGDKYEGSFLNNMAHGQGVFISHEGYQFRGELNESKFTVNGILTDKDGNKINSIEFSKWFNGKHLYKFSETIKLFNNLTNKFEITATATQPDLNGIITINIHTNKEITSMKINNEELGNAKDGIHVVKKIVRVGQESTFYITGVDINGNVDAKSIKVVRQAADSKAVFGQLNAANVRQQPTRDAVAIIIGIERYKRVVKADYANADAQDFYDYASRALGIKPENIKLLVDDGADDVEIYKAFQNWLPVKVKKGKTDVFVFYSGHGYPALDGNSLYILPYGADKDLISKTAINQQEIVSAIENAQPRTVTMFLDSCYSGQTRGGDVLIAGARPIAPKISSNSYPPNFTVISASANDQISSASPDLKHGIFSYFLMKGMEGEADLNKDGRITIAEMHEYLTDMVGRQAMSMNRKQQPQFFGDLDRVLVDK